MGQPYNYKTDVWSLAVLLYEIAALKRPFTGSLDTLPRVILANVYDPLPNLYSQGLRDLVTKMMRVNPAERLDLGGALRNEPLKSGLLRAQEALGLELPPEEPPKKEMAMPSLPASASVPVTQGYAEMRPTDEIQETGASITPCACTPTQPSPPPPPEAGEGKLSYKYHAPALESSHWIGYNTMVRRIQITPVKTHDDAAVYFNAAAAFAQSVQEGGKPSDGLSLEGPGACSTRPQVDPTSDHDDLDSVSDDSWGSVVDTGVDALLAAMPTPT